MSTLPSRAAGPLQAPSHSILIARAYDCSREVRHSKVKQLAQGRTTQKDLNNEMNRTAVSLQATEEAKRKWPARGLEMPSFNPALPNEWSDLPQGPSQTGCTRESPGENL